MPGDNHMQIASELDGDERRALTELSGSDRYRILASERRQAALDALSDRHGPVSLADLAEAIVERDGGDGGVDEVMISLHHRHLPMMNEADVLEYDPDARIVREPPSL